jgi:hypothetical protein
MCCNNLCNQYVIQLHILEYYTYAKRTVNRRFDGYYFLKSS